MNPLVTICILTHSGKRLSYLKEALASVLAQTYQNLEILISQDWDVGSLDETVRIWCQTISNDNPRIKYRYNSHKLGIGGHLNAIADVSRGEYLIFLADDDRLLPNFTKVLVDALKQNTKLVFCNHYLIDNKGKYLLEETHKNTRYYLRDRISPGELSSPEIWAWQGSIPNCYLIKTSEVSRIRFKEDLDCPEIEFFIFLARANGHFIFVPDYLYDYRIHNQQNTSLGFSIERLVMYLLPIEVSAEVEPYKRQCLSRWLPVVVSKFILQGNICEARRLLNSEYYLKTKTLRRLVQNICLILPESLGYNLFRLLYKIKKNFNLKKYF